MDSFLQRMARRLRLVWAWSTTSLLAPIVAGLACLLVAIGWLAPWAWPERAAVGVVASAVLVMMVAAAEWMNSRRFISSSPQ